MSFKFKLLFKLSNFLDRNQIPRGSNFYPVLTRNFIYCEEWLDEFVKTKKYFIYHNTMMLLRKDALWNPSCQIVYVWIYRMLFIKGSKACPKSIKKCSWNEIINFESKIFHRKFLHPCKKCWHLYSPRRKNNSVSTPVRWQNMLCFNNVSHVCWSEFHTWNMVQYVVFAV